MKHIRKHQYFLIVFLFLIPLCANTAIYKNINSEGRVTYSNIRTGGSIRVDMVDPRWELLYENSYNEDKLYFDTKSLSKKGALVRFWMMKVNDDGQDKRYLEMTCGSRSYKILEVQSYLPQMKPNKNLVEYIVPESDIEKAYNFLCKE